MSELKKVDGTLQITANVSCPHCDHYFNLFDITSLNDDGYIYEILLGEDGFGCDGTDEVFDCPKCKKEIGFGKIDW